MITDYNPYYIMDSYLLSKVTHAMQMAIAMAKRSYPHLQEDMENAWGALQAELETFQGTQNKPKCSKAYRKKGGKQ